MTRRRDAEALAEAEANSLEETLADRHVVVCTGSGGVGKTTTAAAIAMAAANRGRRTIVLTIDPARRLAQSLGLSSLDNTPRPVEGVEGLDAMMLDMKRTFDEVIERHADDPRHARKITSNRFYQQLSSTLAGTQEYMAMEKLYDLHTTGTYDCIVIDTPPTRNALDFLDAPKRLTDFLEGRFLKMFLAPGMAAGRVAGRAVGYGTGLFMRAASRITGVGVLGDLAEFFQSFEGMYAGFKARAQAVYKQLQSAESAFVVVTTAEDHALREARYFLQRLAQDGMPTAGLVVNRVTEPAVESVGRHQLHEAAAKLEGDSREPEQQAVAALLRLAAGDLAVSEREQRSLLAAMHGLDPRVLVRIPQRADDIHDLDGLRWVGARLAGVGD